MDNETPKYANWVPEAGGYVANGNVVSKSPQYDESGKLKLNVDTSLFTPQKVATSSGVTQANTEGSKVDVNSSMTTTGSLGSLNINTDNPLESVISSPATKSPVAGEPILSMEDQTNKEYQDAAARGDYQGMINALVSKQNQTGVDQSAEIERLTKMREEKIRNIDDQYLAGYNEAKNIYNQALRNYNEAVASGDEKAVAQAEADLNQAEQQMAQIVNEQSTWRDQVGYQDAMQVAKQRDLEENKIRWVNKYLDGVDEIAGSMIQLVGNYMNFQYDPYSDPKLARAQAYTKATMTEHFSNTGMYNSSSVAYAITQAVSELVPVYEQMAKDEIKDNINMLQSTANFLLNLEESQFDMWRAQVQLQFAANEEKRAERNAAIDRANAIGYFTNEDAAILGVEPGSLSPKAREHEQELLEEIDKENRKLQQDIVMANYNQKLQLDRMEEENRINKDYALFNLGLQKDYWQFQVNHPKPTSSSNTTNTEDTEKPTDKRKYTVQLNDGTLQEVEIDLEKTLSDMKDEDGETFDDAEINNFYLNYENYPTEYLEDVTNRLREDYIYPEITSASEAFDGKYDKSTETAIDGVVQKIYNITQSIEYAKGDERPFIEQSYQRLMDTITTSGFSDKDKKKAQEYVIKKMKKVNDTATKNTGEAWENNYKTIEENNKTAQKGNYLAENSKEIKETELDDGITMYEFVPKDNYAGDRDIG